MMSANDAVLLLHKFDKMLDCTYPPPELAEAIAFDRISHSSVSVSIVAANEDSGFNFCFSIHIAYEEGEEEYLSPDDPVIMKYFNEMKSQP